MDSKWRLCSNFCLIQNAICNDLYTSAEKQFAPQLSAQILHANVHNVAPEFCHKSTRSAMTLEQMNPVAADLEFTSK